MAFDFKRCNTNYKINRALTIIKPIKKSIISIQQYVSCMIELN